MKGVKQMNIYPRAHWYLLLGLAIAIAGFVPSYWTRNLEGFSLEIHIHALTATLWFITLILQPWLIKSGNIRAHRRYGTFAIFVAIALVVTALVITPNNLNLKVRNPDLKYMFIYWDVVTTTFFAVFVILAIHNRKNVQLHSRYMIATVFVPMLPALARGLFFYGIMDNFVSAIYVGNALTLIAISLLIYDDYKKGKIYLPYVAVYSMLALLGFSVEIVGSANWWQSLMNMAVTPFIWTIFLSSIIATYVILVRIGIKKKREVRRVLDKVDFGPLS